MAVPFTWPVEVPADINNSGSEFALSTEFSSDNSVSLSNGMADVTSSMTIAKLNTTRLLMPYGHSSRS